MVTFTSKGRYPKETKLKAWLACFPAGTTKYRVGFHALKPSEQTAYGAQKQNSIFEITAPRQWNTVCSTCTKADIQVEFRGR